MKNLKMSTVTSALFSKFVTIVTIVTIVTTLTLVTIFTLSGCKKNEETPIRTCDLTTITDSLTSSKIVTYTATRTGDGAFAKITYESGSGIVTVTNPILPWTLTLPLSSATKVKMTGLGTVTNGSLMVKFLAAAPGDTSRSSDQCSQTVSK